MVSEKVKVMNEAGLHLRPAGDLCKLAMKFPCKIELKSEHRIVNMKSLIGLLSACVKSGEEVEVICDGEEERIALREIVDELRKVV